MPFSQDPGKRESDQYCSFCFKDGKLCYEGDLKGFQKQAYQGMRQRGMNPILASIFTFAVRFAPRWRQQ
jgi:hypothetical protein